mgnify:CR=1 FL=1
MTKNKQRDKTANLMFLDNNPNPTMIVDLKGGLLYKNLATSNLLQNLGIKEEDFTQLLPPGYLDILQNCQAAEVAIPATRLEYSNRVYIWSAFFSEDQEQAYYQGMNITRMHRNELALRTAKEKAEEGDKLKAAFLDNMSHEIRTPLNSLLGFIQLLKDELEETLREDQKFYFDLVIQNGGRLERTMREILDISHFSSGTYSVRKKLVDLTNIVQEIIDEHAQSIESKGLKLKLDIGEDVVNVMTDEYCLSQAITHLLNNAVKYTDEGEIFVGFEQSENSTVIKIEDTGPGMSDEAQRRIFVAFNQGTMGHSKKYQGIGLGLSLVRVYLDAVSVKIDLDSKLGEGSRFSISIPN